jgi:hypothetical protein
MNTWEPALFELWRILLLFEILAKVPHGRYKLMAIFIQGEGLESILDI